MRCEGGQRLANISDIVWDLAFETQTRQFHFNIRGLLRKLSAQAKLYCASMSATQLAQNILRRWPFMILPKRSLPTRARSAELQTNCQSLAWQELFRSKSSFLWPYKIAMEPWFHLKSLEIETPNLSTLKTQLDHFQTTRLHPSYRTKALELPAGQSQSIGKEWELPQRLTASGIKTSDFIWLRFDRKVPPGCPAMNNRRPTFEEPHN